MSNNKLNQDLHGPIYDMSGLGFRRGEVIVISGAGSGIGRATALASAKSGLAVGVWDMDIEAAKTTAREIEQSGGKAVAVHVNVAEDAAVAKAWDATHALGPCRYLVNNAGPGSLPGPDFLRLLLS